MISTVWSEKKTKRRVHENLANIMVQNYHEIDTYRDIIDMKWNS